MKHGSKLRVKKYRNCDAPEIVIRRAEEELSSQTFKDYDLLK